MSKRLSAETVNGVSEHAVLPLLDQDILAAQEAPRVAAQQPEHALVSSSANEEHRGRSGQGSAYTQLQNLKMEAFKAMHAPHRPLTPDELANVR